VGAGRVQGRPPGLVEEAKRAVREWCAVVTNGARSVHEWLVPKTYPNGLPVGDLRILITWEDDESWSPDKLLDVAAGWGSRNVAQVTVLDASGQCLAKRRFRGWQNAKRVREALAADLERLGVGSGAPPPENLQARLDRI
jgi:hypothetical protein